jgi:Domain of unknown function (DUF4157)
MGDRSKNQRPTALAAAAKRSSALPARQTPASTSARQQLAAPIQLLQPYSAAPCLFTPRSCPFGGACHSCPLGAQAKLAVSQPGDRYEQEADRVADQVMRMAAPRKDDEDEQRLQTKPIAARITPLVLRQAMPEKEEDEQLEAQLQRQETAAPEDEDERETSALQRQAVPTRDEEEEGQSRSLLQRQAAAAPEDEDDEQVQASAQPGHIPQVTPDLAGRIAALRGAGQALPHAERSFFEPRFGHDFSGIRVHTGGEATQLARSVQARAFTVGRDVVFGAGQYVPGSGEGRRLLGHELTHVVQQGSLRDGVALRSELAVRMQRSPSGTPSSPEAAQPAVANYDSRVDRLSNLAIEEIDSFFPSFKVLLQIVLSAHKLHQSQYLVERLRARKHPKHGTYFAALLTNLKSRGSEAIFRIALKLFARAGVAITEVIEDYPLRYQIADYISGKIEETKNILIGEPRDSIWWVLKATLIETFYTLEDGFVDALRVGKGSEEAAKAYAFEKNAIDRWCRVIKGLGEDFLRITVFAAPANKPIARAAQESIATKLARQADTTITSFADDATKLAKEATTQAEKTAGQVTREAAESAKKQVKSNLLENKIQSAEEAMETAARKSRQMPSKKLQDKAVAITERNLDPARGVRVRKTALSGWKAIPERPLKAAPEEVAQHAKKIGHDLPPAGAQDQIKRGGFTGKHYASHAEKQQIVKAPNQPVGVSRPMCADCIDFFQKEATFRGQPQVVSDPYTTRVFEPNGGRIEYWRDGTKVTFEPGGGVRVDPGVSRPH